MTFDELLAIRTHLVCSLDRIDDELLKTDWRHLANRDLKVLAIRAYRQQHNASLSESKKAVDAFMELLNPPKFTIPLPRMD